ncbi:ATP-grasp domain-containing protein [Aeromicrobium sp.]|uniref:ATP-grasp domain-containing protein n=1 Tax=Aeromicrobium sp. TaxID=1871063 RepID=UPI003D6A9EC6
MTIAFATSSTHRDLDLDLPLLLDAAATRGTDAHIVEWDDETVDWSAYDIVVVRSCWDYVERRNIFLAWATRVPRLLNAADVLAWNTDKVYLRELADAGVPVIDTRWDIRHGDDLPRSDEWVVKPAISAGSRDTARWSSPDDAYAHSEALIAARRTVMVQPYVPSVDTEGETALIYLGGRFSHAIRKGPLLERGEGVRQDRDRREGISPRAPTATQLDVAEQALAAVPSALGGADALLYARVDLVTDTDGAPRLIELELSEPSLFLDHSENGAGLLLDALEAR